MARTSPPLLPRVRRLLATVGDNVRTARLRRSYGTELVARRAGITRNTLARIERGEASVAIGVYARVLQALGLEQDLAAIGANDVVGQRLQDAGLPVRARAPRKGARPARGPVGPGKRES